MSKSIIGASHNGRLGVPLSPWTYSSRELFDFEYEAFFLRRWQLVGHFREAAEPGDFVAAEIGRLIDAG